MTIVPTVLLDGEKRNQTQVLYQFQQQICERAKEKVSTVFKAFLKLHEFKILCLSVSLFFNSMGNQ